ncbi:hypothetical protein JOC78_002152 [Bacillus ectoiniformans]|uniref:hypothetical protein n=1 Tax=Bacillus ectoiniformans TaxID=1494429 RepID=UPI00195C3BB5|nr:hypothetical protein [Bacillus ectoiniformans]MBM7649199.1 hypothetical protein [Bacillus ectoiniformans]
MAIVTDNESFELDCTVTDQEYLWKKNCIKAENNYLVSKGLITNVRIPIKHIDTVVYSMNPKKPAIVPVLKIIGQGTVLAEMDIPAIYIESVQDWLLQVIEQK